MKYRIAHIGSFDVENYGDLLFSDVLKAQLEKKNRNRRNSLFCTKTLYNA